MIIILICLLGILSIYTVKRLSTKKEFNITTGAKYHINDTVIIGNTTCTVSAKGICPHEGYYSYTLKEV